MRVALVCGNYSPRASGIDPVVHVQWAPSAFSWAPWAGLLPHLTSAPVVTTLHEYGWWTWPAKFPHRAWRPLERTGLWDRETMLLGREPALVPIGPDGGAIGLSGRAARALVQERWGVPTGVHLLVFFGFVHPVKGVRYLLSDARR